MFISKNQVRVHDTDMAGILYFPRQFRFAHDALEDFLQSFGMTYTQVFHEMSFVFVVVHAESDYYATLRAGDLLNVHLIVENVGTTSFTIRYEIYKNDKTLAGKAKTIHVTLDTVTRVKIPVPEDFRQVLIQHLT